MIADGYDAFLFDLDGVLYRGSAPVPGAPETIRSLRSLGKGMAFVTNNSARTPQAVVDHLRSVAIEAAPEEVVTSALVTAELVGERGLRTAYVIGGEGLRSALAARGLQILDGEPREADVVVVGWDRGITYDALRIASVLIEDGAAFVASNADASFPAADGHAWPGAGATVAAIETTTGARAEVVGKPHPPLLEAARRAAGDGRPLLVGDRLDTDIVGAAGLGWDSALVLTGISTREEADAGPIRPTYVVVDLRGLVDEA
ncbi:MAG: HAD-IIA family hydrolase [Actinomycetota bacterium]